MPLVCVEIWHLLWDTANRAAGDSQHFESLRKRMLDWTVHEVVALLNEGSTSYLELDV
jgi:hypothetical protein